MADGKQYEGVGIAADVEVRTTAADYERKRDAVLEVAGRYVNRGR